MAFADRRWLGLVAVGSMLSGCMLWSRPPATPEPEPIPPANMPEIIPSGQISPLPQAPAPSADPNDPLAGRAPGENVSINAVGVDVRALLTSLADAAGLSLVIGPEVTGRISVNLVDVPALEAFRLILAETELMVAAPSFSSPWGPVVFYVLPVNVWEADSELLQARYRLSPEMADWIVESRLDPIEP